MREALFVAPEVAGVRRLLAPLVGADDWHATPVEWQLGQMAELLLAAHAAGDERVRPVFSSWHPTLCGASVAQVLAAELTREDCLLTVAREHGFETPPTERLEHRPAFERAVDAVVHGELDALRELLDAEPGLATARSSYGHRATLLHYVGSNGVETWRQVCPGNVVEVARLLLERGAEVDAEASMYGGATTLALVSSSSHPQQAGVRGALERALVAAGAQGVAAPVDSDAVKPILSCSALRETLAVFRDELGFSVTFEWGEPADFAGVCLDRSELFLCEGGQGGPGTWVMVFVADVDAYAGSLRLERAELVEGPVDRPWGVRELLVRLPDEHVIRFGGPCR